jgi:hypothetical protein
MTVILKTKEIKKLEFPYYREHKYKALSSIAANTESKSGASKGINKYF